jgi:hypothetical protein
MPIEGALHQPNSLSISSLRNASNRSASNPDSAASLRTGKLSFTWDLAEVDSSTEEQVKVARVTV